MTFSCHSFNLTKRTIQAPHVGAVQPSSSCYHHSWADFLLVIEFGGFMASSALCINAVQKHYSDFLEMNHMNMAKGQKKWIQKLLRKFSPSLFLLLLVSFWRSASFNLWAASFKMYPAELFLCHFDPSFFFISLTSPWACLDISSPPTDPTGHHLEILKYNHI